MQGVLWELGLCVADSWLRRVSQNCVLGACKAGAQMLPRFMGLQFGRTGCVYSEATVRTGEASLLAPSLKHGYLHFKETFNTGW